MSIKIFWHTEWPINLDDNNYSSNTSDIADENIPEALFDETNTAIVAFGVFVYCNLVFVISTQNKR